jgi:hypothetical protein
VSKVSGRCSSSGDRGKKIDGRIEQILLCLAWISNHVRILICQYRWAESCWLRYHWRLLNNVTHGDGSGSEIRGRERSLARSNFTRSSHTKREFCAFTSLQLARCKRKDLSFAMQICHVVYYQPPHKICVLSVHRLCAWRHIGYCKRYRKRKGTMHKLTCRWITCCDVLLRT